MRFSNFNFWLFPKLKRITIKQPLDIIYKDELEEYFQKWEYRLKKV